MSSILCLWKYSNYRREKEGGLDYNTPAYNSKQSRLHSATQLGERAYVVTYVDGRCYLIERITITENSKYNNEPDDPGYDYGKFGISGNPPESQYYDKPIDVTETLRQFRFKTGKRIGNSPRPLSLYLQTIRELTEDDVALLESCIP